MTLRRLLAAGVAAAAIACAAPAAASANADIQSDPLHISADGLGALQVFYGGSTTGEFFPPDSATGNAGLELVDRSTNTVAALDRNRTVVTDPAASTSGAMHEIASSYTLDDLNVRVDETITYFDGANQFSVDYAIHNLSATDTIGDLDAGEVADLYTGGSDRGRGMFTPGAQRFVGGQGESGGVGGLTEVTPWDHYEESGYSSVFSDFEGGTLSDSVDPDLIDNGVAASHDFGALAPGASVTFTVAWSFSNLGVNTEQDGDDGSCDRLDANDPTKNCTLTEALTDTPAGATVAIPAGTYPVSETIFTTVDHDVVGDGAQSTFIDGNDLQALHVQNGTLSLSGVTVQHGNSGQGGGIAVDAPATLNLTDGAVSHNTASGPGGGIYSQGVVSLIRSTVDNNQAVGGNGGGVATDGTNGPFLHVEDSTISDNTSTLAGGGISVGPGTSLALMNTTVAGNSAPGGGDALEFRASNGSANLLNTILAGSGHAACAGTSNALFTDHLLATDKTCPFPTANGDRVGDPKLGVLTDNGGPTETRAIDDTSPAFDAGDDQTCLPADQRGLDRPQGAHCDIGAFEAFVDSSPPPDGTPTPTPTPTPRPSPTPTPSPSPTPGPTPLPPPVYGTTFNAEKSKGLVRYRKPGSKKYVTLKAGAQLPKGTLVDTTKGRVTLTSADQNGKTQHAWFYEGIFKIGGQTKGKKPVTLLDLAGPKPQCGSGAKKSAVAARKRRSRHLWGSGKGRFRTTGQFSSATVRGTIWLTQDSCQGTLVKVKRGIVAVDDFTKHRTFLVKAGHSHLAKRRP